MQPYSLGIPVKNEENTIGQLITSALHQENPPENIYVCVNGSSDRTKEIVTSLAEKFQTIIPLTSLPGKANAWNAIVHRAKLENTFGDVMVFCDGDIRFGSPNTLSSLVQCTRESAHVIMGASIIQLPSERCVPKKLKSPSGQLYALKRDMLTVLQEKHGGFLPNNIINEDLLLTLLAFPDVDVTDNSYFYSARPDLKDLVMTQHRILKGIRQIIDMGMGEQLEKLIQRMMANNGSNFSKNLKYRLVSFLIHFVRVRSGDYLWPEPLSTKRYV